MKGELKTELTRREKEVLAEYAQGKSSQEVADTLFVSHRTIEKHCINIREKLGLPHFVALVVFAVRWAERLL